MRFRKRNSRTSLLILLLLVIVVSLAGCSSDDQNKTNTSTKFTGLASWAQKIAIDDTSGAMYIAGYAYGTDISGDSGTGEADIFVAKVDKDNSGNIIWLKQIDSDGDDYVQDIFVSPAGDIYLAGYTEGNLDGSSTTDNYDIFIIKYDMTGDQQWIQQLDSGSNDFCWGITVDASDNIYVVGNTDGVMPGSDKTNEQGIDLFIMKLDGSSDTPDWTEQLGSDELISTYIYSKNYGVAIALDNSGDIIIGGITNDILGDSNLGGNDLILAKYDASSGEQIWISQFGSSDNDQLKRVKISNSGDIYVTGYTYGTIVDASRDNTDYDLDNSYTEVFLYRFQSNSTGTPPVPDWIKQTGTSVDDWAHDLAFDSSDNVFLVGNTDGDVTDDNAGSTDFFILKYDATGDLLWGTQNGSTKYDSANGITLDANDNIYIVGRTYGTLDSKTNSDQAFEAFISLYTDSSPNASWTKILGED